MYSERLLVPGLIAGIKSLGLDQKWFFALIVLSAFPASLSLAYIGRSLFGHRGTGWLAQALYCCYPFIYAYGTLIETDVLHANIVVIAAALLLAFISTGLTSYAVMSGVATALAQLTRPSLFMLPLVAPLLLARNWRSPPLRRSTLIWAALLLLVPLGLGLHNYVYYGVFRPSLVQVEMLNTWTIPKICVIQENRVHPAPLTPSFNAKLDGLRSEDWWKQLHSGYTPRDIFQSCYWAKMKDAKLFLLDNIPDLIRTSWGEFTGQLLCPFTYHNDYHTPKLQAFYPQNDRWPEVAVKIFLPLCVLGLGRCVRQRQYTWFVMISILFFLILGPASLSMWAGPRYKMILDLMLLPCVAAVLFRPASWTWIVGVAFGSYVLHGLISWPNNYLLSAMLVLGCYLYWEWHNSRVRSS